jgi:glutathione-independent formaldehyde dehydrogenase
VRAVVFADTRSVAVEDVPDALLEEPDDVVVQISSTANLLYGPAHLRRAHGGDAGLALGHEPLGVVEQAGRQSRW